MNDEVDAFGGGDTNFEDGSVDCCTDEHCEIFGFVDSDWVSVRVEHVVVGNTVLAGAVDNDRIHRHQLTLILHETETWGC